MKRYVMSSLCLVGTMLAGATIVGEARAHTILALAGGFKGEFDTTGGHGTQCTSSDDGVITVTANAVLDCPSTQDFYMPVVIDSTGTFTATVYVSGGGSTGLTSSCESFKWSSSGVESTGGYVSTTTSTSIQAIVMNNLTINGGDLAGVYCGLPQGATLQGAAW